MNRIQEMFQRIKEIFKNMLIVLCVFGCMYLIAALILGNSTVHATRDAGMGEIEIFIFSNGVHTDIVMPVHTDNWNWHDVLPPMNVEDALAAEMAQYVGIGWGSRRFYLETRTFSDLNAGNVWEALSGMGDTAMHVSYYSNMLLENEHTISVRLSKAEYERLTSNIWASFVQQEGRGVPLLAAGYTSADVFYEAKGHYHIFQTCNTWVNDVLKKSGLTAVMWTPFAWHILDAYQESN